MLGHFNIRETEHSQPMDLCQLRQSCGQHYTKMLRVNAGEQYQGSTDEEQPVSINTSEPTNTLE